MSGRKRKGDANPDADVRLLGERLAALPSLSRAELAALWQRYYRSKVPPRVRRGFLELAVGWGMQAEVLGGLPSSLEAQLAAVGRDGGGIPARRRLKAGTRLVREWHGTVYVVEVQGRGYVWQDKPYRSLSAIARKITGASWSGPRFFGVSGSVGK
jgi:hypothetical protein